MAVSLPSGSTLFLTVSQSDSILIRRNPLNTPTIDMALLALSASSQAPAPSLNSRELDLIILPSPSAFSSQTAVIEGASSLLLRVQSLRVQLPTRIPPEITLQAPLQAPKFTQHQYSDSTISESQSASSDRSISRFGFQSPGNPEYNDEVQGSPVSFTVELTAFLDDREEVR